MGRFGKNKNLFGTCPFCSNGLMILDNDGIYYECSECGHSLSKDNYLLNHKNPFFDVETVGDESYEEIYDDDGIPAYIKCDYCQTKIKFKNGQYICPNCESIISRDEYFNYIGSTPPGPECSTCNSNYPNCIICPYGYK